MHRHGRLADPNQAREPRITQPRAPQRRLQLRHPLAPSAAAARLAAAARCAAASTHVAKCDWNRRTDGSTSGTSSALASDDTERRMTQWGYQDFLPIAEAMDTLFESMGWLTKE